LAKQILGIQSSQIKIKLIFSIVGVFTSLWWCCLEDDNLDKLAIRIYKN
jgi:hypothetical protein